MEEADGAAAVGVFGLLSAAAAAATAAAEVTDFDRSKVGVADSHCWVELSRPIGGWMEGGRLFRANVSSGSVSADAEGGSAVTVVASASVIVVVAIVVAIVVSSASLSMSNFAVGRSFFFLAQAKSHLTLTAGMFHFLAASYF